MVIQYSCEVVQVAAYFYARIYKVGGDDGR